MASGAAATIRQNRSRSPIQRARAPFTRSVSQAATAIRGGTGPVRRDNVPTYLKGA